MWPTFMTNCMKNIGGGRCHSNFITEHQKLLVNDVQFESQTILIPVTEEKLEEMYDVLP